MTTAVTNEHAQNGSIPHHVLFVSELRQHCWWESEEWDVCRGATYSANILIDDVEYSDEASTLQ